MEKASGSEGEREMSDGTTHYAGCIQAGPKHYECALQEVGRLRTTIMYLRVKLEAADNRNTAMMRMGDRLIAEKKPWVGLTDEEAAECWSTSAVGSWKNIEAKLREKNGG
jgi:hypothetical protein